MRRHPLLLPVLLALAPASTAIASDHPDHATAPEQRSTTSARWQADAVLHESMEHVQAAVEGYEHFEHGHMNREQAGILADLIDRRVQTIISNCRLVPEADAALHRVLHSLIEGAAAIKKEPTSSAAIASLRQAVTSYRQLFLPPANADARSGAGQRQ